jgi:ABC-2 type transport system permease protein
MKVKIPHYPTFMFIGLLIWNMFVTGVLGSASVIVRQGSLVKKIYFPREILPLAVVGGALINYLFSLIILVPFVIFSGLRPTFEWVFIPLIILVAIVLTAGFALLFSAINVFLRDLEHMLGIFMMLWFYLTPVIYSLSMIPRSYAQIFKLNPMADVVLSLQSVIYYGQSPHWKLFLYGSIFAALIFVIGLKTFSRLSRRFAEEV